MNIFKTRKVSLNLARIKDVIEQLGQSQPPFVKALANQRKVFLLVSIA